MPIDTKSIAILLHTVIDTGGVAVRGLTATAPIRAENITCPSNATLASHCTAIEPPISESCYRNTSAAGVQCIQGIILLLSLLVQCPYISMR